MNVPTNFTRLKGSWVGEKHLWLDPGAKPHQSDCKALVSLAARAKFLEVQYTWSYEGEPQEGMLLVGFNPQQLVADAAWIDSWHMDNKIMVCEGEVRDNMIISLKGAYAAPPDPDWGWWIEIDPQDGQSFKLLMYNVSPKGKADLAVKILFKPFQEK